MNKKSKILLFSLTGIASAGVVVSFGAKSANFTGLRAEQNGSWTHYETVMPTATTKGIKEYWVSCDDNSHVFEKPTTGVVKEGEWTAEKQASVIATNDDRVLAAGDLKGYMLQNLSTLKKYFVAPRDIYSIAENKETFTMHVGSDKGTREGGEYTPSNNTAAAFYITTDFLRDVRAAGYANFTLTVSGTSTIPELTASRFATITSGDGTVGDDWKTNYWEYRTDFAGGFTQAFDLAVYDEFFSEEKTPRVEFLIRDQKYEQINAVESDIVVEDIQFLKGNVIGDITQARGNSSHKYKYDENERIVEYSKTIFAEAGMDTVSGVSASHFARLASEGIVRAEVDYTLNPDDASVTMFWHKVGNKEEYDFGEHVTLPVNDTTTLVGCFPYANGHSQSTGKWSASLDYYDYESAYLRVNHFSIASQTANHPYGILCTEVGTFTNKASGSGAVGGNTVCKDGASVTLTRDGVTKERPLSFYGDHINILNYKDPVVGDVIVFHAGTYQDPENQWNLNRTWVLDKTLTFEFVGKEFKTVI